jgi:hypothetical protein
MDSAQLIPSLMFMTLAAAAGFGVLQLFWFLQRRSNRQAAEHALVGAGRRNDAGALPEIAGVGAVALLAMALLLFGYNSRESVLQTATVPTSATQPASATDQMTNPPRPRANPADMAQPPTQYPLGSGSPATAPTAPAPSPDATTGTR